MVGGLVHSKVSLSEAASQSKSLLTSLMDEAFMNVAKGGEDDDYIYVYENPDA